MGTGESGGENGINNSGTRPIGLDLAGGIGYVFNDFRPGV